MEDAPEYDPIELAARLAIEHRDLEMLRAALALGANPSMLSRIESGDEKFPSTLVDHARWRGWYEGVSFMSGEH